MPPAHANGELAGLHAYTANRFTVTTGTVQHELFDENFSLLSLYLVCEEHPTLGVTRRVSLNINGGCRGTERPWIIPLKDRKWDTETLGSFHEGTRKRFRDREEGGDGVATIPGTRQATQKSASHRLLSTEVDLEDSDSDKDERGRLLTWEMGLSCCQ